MEKRKLRLEEDRRRGRSEGGGGRAGFQREERTGGRREGSARGRREESVRGMREESARGMREESARGRREESVRGRSRSRERDNKRKTSSRERSAHKERPRVNIRESNGSWEARAHREPREFREKSKESFKETRRDVCRDRPRELARERRGDIRPGGSVSRNGPSNPELREHDRVKSCREKDEYSEKGKSFNRPAKPKKEDDAEDRASGMEEGELEDSGDEDPYADQIKFR